MPREVPLAHPGMILLEDWLVPLGLSQYALAKAIGVPPRRINEIVKGLRGITVDTALRLAAFSAPTPKAGSICKCTSTPSRRVRRWRRCWDRSSGIRRLKWRMPATGSV